MNDQLSVKDGFIIPLIEMTNIQKEHIELYEKTN